MSEVRTTRHYFRRALTPEQRERIDRLARTDPRTHMAAVWLDERVEDPAEVLVRTIEGLAADLAATRAHLATVLASTPPAPMRLDAS